MIIIVIFNFVHLLIEPQMLSDEDFDIIVDIKGCGNVTVMIVLSNNNVNPGIY